MLRMQKGLKQLTIDKFSEDAESESVGPRISQRDIETWNKRQSHKSNFRNRIYCSWNNVSQNSNLRYERWKNDILNRVLF
jgi:hypothetical protein